MIHIFDGAIGTMLQNAGLQPGECPELVNVERPDMIRRVHVLLWRFRSPFR